MIRRDGSYSEGRLGGVARIYNRDIRFGLGVSVDFFVVWMEI